MKPAPFAWARPAGMMEATRALSETDARAMAGGQSLGPMLNLRAARPATVVSLAGLAELHGAEDAADAITLGAATTHAAIADGRTPDFAAPNPVWRGLQPASRIAPSVPAARSAAACATPTRPPTGS